MHTDSSPQIASLENEFRAASERAGALVRSGGAERMTARPVSGGWSPVECLMHLNLTAKQFLPLLHSRISQAKRDGLEGSGRFRMDWRGRFLAWFLDPPYRFRGTTVPAAVPDRPRPPEPVLEEFTALNAQLILLMQEAADLSWDDIEVVSPFHGKVKYNLYSAFRVVAAHERRHLWQAERILGITS